MSCQDLRSRLENLYHTVTKNKNDLFKICHMPIRTFRRCYNILKMGGSLERKPGSGRSKKLTGQDRQKLSRIALMNPTFSARNVHQNFVRKTGKDVSRSTVQRNLKQSGIHKKLPKKVPQVTEAHEQKRLDFSRTWKDYHFQDVFFNR